MSWPLAQNGSELIHLSGFFPLSSQIFTQDTVLPGSCSFSHHRSLERAGSQTENTVTALRFSETQMTDWHSPSCTRNTSYYNWNRKSNSSLGWGHSLHKDSLSYLKTFHFINEQKHTLKTWKLPKWQPKPCPLSRRLLVNQSSLYQLN